MKIHLLCKRFYTGKDLIRDRFGRLYHLPVQLKKLGADIRVTTIDYRHTIAERHVLDDVEFKTLPATPTRLLSSLLSLKRALSVEHPDILIASGDSHIGYLGLRLARGLGIPFGFDVYDYYPAFASNRIPGMKTLFFQAVSGADLVLCASTPLMERLVPLNAARLLVENGVDRNLFCPQDRPKSRTELGLDLTIPVIGYFGSLFEYKGPLLIDACRILIRSIPELRLLIAGPVRNLDIGYPWITYLGERSQSDIPRLIAACDVCVVPLAHHPQNDLSGSCKIAEYLSCAKPVVATDIAGHREIFRTAPQSLCQPDPTDMAEAISRQLDQPQVAPFPAHLEWEVIARTLLDALSDLPRTKSAA